MAADIAMFVLVAAVLKRVGQEFSLYAQQILYQVFLGSACSVMGV
jgi:hypothetical protein